MGRSHHAIFRRIIKTLEVIELGTNIERAQGNLRRAHRIPEPELAQEVSRFLAQFPGASRAEAVHLTLKALLARVEPDRVLMCELAWEVHTHAYVLGPRKFRGRSR